MVSSPHIHGTNTMNTNEINKEATIKVDNPEDYKPGERIPHGDGYGVIMDIVNEYDLSVIKNETGILH